MTNGLPTVGFVIVSHNNPGQLRRLVATLGREYGDPPIACHHDFAQCPLDRAAFPSNVRFVTPSLRTRWGTWSVVASHLAALALLYEDGGPDWFMLLSGADYPLQPGATVRGELAACGCDAFIDIHQSEPVPPRAVLTGRWNRSLAFLEGPTSYPLKRRFYRARQFWLPILRRAQGWRPGRLTVRLPFDSGFFTDDFGLFWGDVWQAGNRRVADVLLHPTPRHRALQRYLRWRTFPDECYFQTVLGNTEGLTLNRDSRRYTDWRGGAHPIVLGEAELDAALASNAHFGRKFAPDAPVLDRIDARLAGAAE